MPVYRGSWYSQLPPFGWFDRQDRPGSSALGVPDSQQGIALPSRSTLGQWYNVTPPGGGIPYPMQQTDIGPAKWTGRGVDISAAAAHQMGYTPNSFPTNADFKIEPRDEPRGLGSPAGMPVQAGDLPDNATNETAIASGPPQGQKMPNSLMDMFQPQNAAGQPVGFGDALASRSNSLIGLGLGLLQPSRPLQGESAYGNALQGYMGGAGLDARTAAEAAKLAHQKTQDARQAAMDKFNMGLREREFTQSQLTPYQKMQADIERAKGTPNEQQVADFYRSQLDAGPPQTREIFDPTLGRNIVQEWDSRSRQYKTATQGGASTATAPANPFTVGTGRPVYGQGGDYSTPAAPTGATATQGQPVQPARKPLTAHEQTAIDEADKALAANQQAIGNLQYAKQLSKQAASGPFALERGQAGSLLPGFLGAGGKETVMLHNVIINNAVDQLKTAFGGNPSEGERKILLEMQGSANAPDAVRQDIFDRGIKLAKTKLEDNSRRSREIRSGTYYMPGGGPPAPTPQAQQAPSAAPRPGTVQKGYVFKGGDPSDQSNWAPVK